MSSSSSSRSHPINSVTSGICSRSATIPKSRWPMYLITVMFRPMPWVMTETG